MKRLQLFLATRYIHYARTISDFCSTFVLFQHGVGLIAFSPDSTLLVSAGFKHDRQLRVWDMVSQTCISVQKLGNKVHGLVFHPNGSLFVTCGDRHLKFWNISKSAEGIVDIVGKPGGILEEHRESVFVDVCFGPNDKLFGVTSSGIVCTFDSSRMMNKWIQLDTASAYGLKLWRRPDGEPVIFVGCAAGVLRVLSGDTLETLTDLPLPAPLSESDARAYPACYAVSVLEGGTDKSKNHPKVVAFYADRGICVWDVSDLSRVRLFRSMAHHRACIWDLHFVQNATPERERSRNLISLPIGSFVTCSADNTVRFWAPIGSGARKKSDMLHALELGPTMDISSRSGAQGGGAGLNSSIASATSVASATSISTANASALLDSPMNAMDFSSGLPDKELPDRAAGVSAPRVR